MVMEHIASMLGACSAPYTLPSSISPMPLDQLSHQLIHDMLTHIQLPPPVEQYLGDVYFKLQAFVSTPDWNTPLPLSFRATPSHPSFPPSALTLWSSWLTSTLLEGMYHVFPHQTQNHCLLLTAMGRGTFTRTCRMV